MIRVGGAIGVALIMISCGNDQHDQNSGMEDSQVSEIDTLTVDDFVQDLQREDIPVKYMTQEREKLNGPVIPGDTILVQLAYLRDDKQIKNFRLGVIPKSDNISVKRRDNNILEFVVYPATKKDMFHFETYIYSEDVVFENAFHDTITGFSENPLGHSVGLLSYAYPIRIKE